MAKKLLILALALLMVIPLATSCADPEKPADTTVAPAATTEPAETVDQRYIADLPSVKFGDEIFNILCEGSFWATETTIYMEEESSEPVDSAVWRRCVQIQEEFGAIIQVTPSADTTSALSNNEKSGDKAYQAIIARMPLIASSAANNNLLDLHTIEAIDLTKLYWDQSANSQLSIGGRLFYTVGDIITTEDSATWTMMFNKKMATALDLEDLYTVVREGRWTFDYFYSLLKDSGVSQDNGDSTWDHLDTYAFATHRDMAYGFFYAAGLSFVKKNGEDLPVLDAKDNEKIQKVLEYSVKVMREDNLTLDAHKWVHVRAAAHELIAEAFQQDRALFFCEVLATIIGFREMDTDFGILPLPKYDAAQTAYTTFVNPAASLVGVPASMASDDNAYMSGVILEAMAYYGHEFIVPAFIEKAIKGVSTRDVESIEMLDIIFSNRMYDLGLINDWGTLSSAYSDLVFNGKTTYASTYEKKSKAADKAITKFLSKLK